jgi:hypothetical protein
MDTAGTMATLIMANTSAPYHASMPAVHFFEEYLATISGWQIAATTLLVLIVYDQCQSTFLPAHHDAILLTLHSHLHQEQRINRRANVQAAIHWPISSSIRSEVRSLQEAVRQRQAKLCICLP